MTDSGSNYKALHQAVVGSSKRRNWKDAVHEWEVTGLEEDPGGHGICICGQLNLVYLYTITNRVTGDELHPIGSSCIKNFDRPDLDREASLLGDLIALRKAIASGEDITLTGDYFTRAMLKYLYDEGAFDYNGQADYEFMLDMFNKKKKEDITPNQRKKIWATINWSVTPFLRSHPRLR